jgi:hypothetical protein
MCLRLSSSNGWNRESLIPSNSSGLTRNRVHSERLNAGVAFTQLPVEQELGVAVEHEEIGAHLRGELRSRDVVPDVGVAHARRDAEARAHAASSAALGTHQPLPCSMQTDAR